MEGKPGTIRCGAEQGGRGCCETPSSWSQSGRLGPFPSWTGPGAPRPLQPHVTRWVPSLRSGFQCIPYPLTSSTSGAQEPEAALGGAGANSAIPKEDPSGLPGE